MANKFDFATSAISLDFHFQFMQSKVIPLQNEPKELQNRYTV